eukprot:TRINITY_DN9990_c0_g1_i1.p1 TRINITY_DN9990_c0_g1~~TRINITY_DN9990_c0_g1_i1.p1  ORF type:complete len:516 (-),score=119.14 TRINITY_DN9990_c0_g1_i1:131-1678(-)
MIQIEQNSSPAKKNDDKYSAFDDIQQIGSMFPSQNQQVAPSNQIKGGQNTQQQSLVKNSGELSSNVKSSVTSIKNINSENKFSQSQQPQQQLNNMDFLESQNKNNGYSQASSQKVLKAEGQISTFDMTDDTLSHQQIPSNANSGNFFNKILQNSEQEVKDLIVIKNQAETLNNSLTQEKNDLIRRYEQLQQQKEQLFKDISVLQTSINLNNSDIIKYRNLFFKITDEVFDRLAQLPASNQQQLQVQQQQTKAKPQSPEIVKVDEKPANQIVQTTYQQQQVTGQAINQPSNITQQQMRFQYLQSPQFQQMYQQQLQQQNQQNKQSQESQMEQNFSLYVQQQMQQQQLQLQKQMQQQSSSSSQQQQLQAKIESSEQKNGNSLNDNNKLQQQQSQMQQSQQQQQQPLQQQQQYMSPETLTNDFQQQSQINNSSTNNNNNNNSSSSNNIDNQNHQDFTMKNKTQLDLTQDNSPAKIDELQQICDPKTFDLHNQSFGEPNEIVSQVAESNNIQNLSLIHI